MNLQQLRRINTMSQSITNV